MIIKKRFIAGATCPNCASLDSLRCWVDNKVEIVECVECSYINQCAPKSIEVSELPEQEIIGIFKS